jgi:putative DNA primase/helicase
MIPANLPRDDWARIGAAIKSEFPDDCGFEAVRHLEPIQRWIQRQGHARDTWKSLKASGPATIWHAVL